MIFILHLVFTLGTSGIAVDHVEYPTLAECEAAGHKAEAKWNGRPTAEFICSEKSVHANQSSTNP